MRENLENPIASTGIPAFACGFFGRSFRLSFSALGNLRLVTLIIRGVLALVLALNSLATERASCTIQLLLYLTLP
jgi:hypothetical protein